jgi:hypothetical protein
MTSYLIQPGTHVLGSGKSTGVHPEYRSLVTVITSKLRVGRTLNASHNIKPEQFVWLRRRIAARDNGLVLLF